MTLWQSRMPHRLRALLVCAATSVLLLSAAAPVNAGGIGGGPSVGLQAGPGRVRDPNTPVADGGRVTSPRELRSLRGLSGYVGDGVSGGHGAFHKTTGAVDPTVTSNGTAPLSIIGDDGRVRVAATTTYPARAVVLLTVPVGSQGEIKNLCTGWLYGPDVVATAGHCLHPTPSGSWVPRQNIRIWPGRNGSRAPYGSCGARRLYSVVGWTQYGDIRYDYGAIKLDCKIGRTVGWFGFWWQRASLTGQATTIAGYPHDKPFATMWTHSDHVRVTEARRIYYQNDTDDGQSGSAVYRNRPAGSWWCVGPCSMGIHTRSGSTYNSGVRIVEPVFNNLISWRDQA
jgi:glutamyl endopeptidase